MSFFGDGRMAAAALRERVLELIGAEPEWAEGDHDSDVVSWTSGPVTTFLAVENGPNDAPGLGVLRVMTPVATVGDREAGLGWCSRMNGAATSNRWTIAPGRVDDAEAEILRVGCSFVVGPHNLADLGVFAAWSVREQVAAAMSQLTPGTMAEFTGDLCVSGAEEERREHGDRREAVAYDDRADAGNDDLDGSDLVASLRAAFLTLREEMLAEGTGAWSSPEWKAGEFSCEMPAAWAPYPGGEIHWDPQRNSPPTEDVFGRLATYPHLGTGLMITMSAHGYGAGSHETVSTLNRLDEQAVAATHYIGGWSLIENGPRYGIFLPAALLAEDIAWPAVMREILLTFARQAQLARRVVTEPKAQMVLDGGTVQPVGLEASLKPHGLAWGETGEGRNPVAWYLDMIFESLVGQDTEWAYPAENGFIWWPYQRAQTVTATDRGTVAGVREVVRIRVATEVRANIPDTPGNLTRIAKRNASLAESALVLRDDGALLLACQVTMTRALAGDAEDWLADLAIRQLITARALSAELTDVGVPASSAHPVQGPRPEPDVWFGRHEELLREAVGEQRADMPESRPQVALMAAAGGYALPIGMAAHDDGVLEFTWRPEHTPSAVPRETEIRVTATPGAGEAEPAWVIHSHLPITGDEAARARWCNERNTALLLDPGSASDAVVIGGWGLTPEGECCLVTGQTRQLVRGDEREAARKLGYLLREEQSIILEAINAAPEAVLESPLTASELAAGLDTVRAAFGRLLGEEPDLPWSAEPLAEGVLVTCGEVTMEVPVGYGRAQLALVYGELLASFPDGRPWLSLYPLFPEPAIGLALAELAREGLLWVDEDGSWVFDAGHARAQLRTVWVRRTGKSGTAEALRVVGDPGDSGISASGVTIPPAQFAWDIEPAAVDVLAYVMRHVISQVREAARQAERSRKPPLPERPRLFGSGRYAAAALRARLLELLAAEPEWMLGDHDSQDIVWSSGLATTVFEVTEGAAATPDLGVLRVYTPVAAAGNGNAARDLCLELNRFTATARWSVARERDPDGGYYDEVQVSCAFVVGPHNQDTLESFALWCVREQIATATAHIRSGDVAGAVAGVYSRYTGFPAGGERAEGHPVTSFTEHVVQPSASLSADVLAEEVLAAFQGLRQAMFDERTDAWFTSHDGLPLTCETPFSWDSYRHSVTSHVRIGDDDPEDRPGTALIESVPVEHPHLGNGLRIAVHVPRDPRGHAGRAINTLNRLDAEVTGASHSLGGWTMAKTAAGEGAPGCVIFLPAAFAESVANRPLVMREILLTLARQALLARRVLLPPERQSADDRAAGIGLAAAADPLATFVRGPHGLAWGETGEGRNPAARVLDQIYATCVGPDADWADTRADGFTWWPYQQAQDITATLRSSSDVAQGVSIRIATDVRRHVPVTAETQRAVAAMNAELGQSALVLGDDGLLLLACRLYVHEGIDNWANQWAQTLSAEQFILARDMSSKLAGLGGFGEDAVSGHPFSGMRPQPDELFGIRENSLIPAAKGVQAGLTPLVPLLGLCRLYPLPLGMSVADPGGGLDVTWRPSQSHTELPVDPVVRVSVRRGDAGSGPGWIVRSVLPVTGDKAARARWCNDRNLDLLADGEDSGDDLTLVGGWGLTPDGECCLTTWLSPFFVPDAIPQAAGLVGNVLSYQAAAVLSALAADPGAVTGAPALTPQELARGLSSVLASFAQVLEYPADFRWSVVSGADDVIVALTGPAAGDSAVDGVALAEAGESELRTVLRVPLTRNRAQLGLLYAAFLGRSVTRARSFSHELVPGEYQGWNFAWRHIEEGLGRLDEEGLIDWDESQGAFVFDSGETGALLRFERLEQFRPHGGMALRLTATVPDMNLAALRDEPAGNTAVLGTWTQTVSGLSYTVTIPPAGMIFGSDFIVVELLTWVGRHVITHVRNAVHNRVARDALPGRAAKDAQPDRAGNAGISWHDHGDGTGAIMSGEDLVASFSARFLVADEYPENPPPDRSEETRRIVEEGTAALPTSGQGERELVAWVARKWQAQLDAWWMFGEPVFWCEHINPDDDDDQPLMDWFMRFPGAVACGQCGDRIRAALLTGKRTAICDSCGKETAETTFGRTPGLSVIANYEVCRTCAALFISEP